MEKTESVDQVEDVAKLPIENADEVTITKSTANASGTVKLLAGKIVYIPTPTADPRGLYLEPGLCEDKRN
jgi:hypothetical protein